MAIQHYSKSICLDPSNAPVFANRGLVYFKMNKFEAADDDCTMALELDPTYVKAWTRRGTVRFKLGKYAEVTGEICIYILFL